MSGASTQVLVDGHWLTELAAWGELEYVYGWPGDCLEASWTMTARYGAHHAAFHRDALVVLRRGTDRQWAGLLQEPEWNGREAKVTARGMYRVGENYSAFDGAFAASTNPSVAIAAQIGRGLPWRLTGTVPNETLHEEQNDVPSVAGLCDQHADQNGVRWGVDAQQRVYFAGAPTAVDYHIHVGAGELSPVDDDFASHVVLNYTNGSGGTSRVVFPTAGTGPNNYERRYGHNDWRKDISDLGPMGDAEALELATNVYTRSLETPGWNAGIELIPGELLTAGGTVADFNAVRANKLVRIHGVANEITHRRYIDVVIGRVTRKPADKTLTIDPVGLVRDNPEDAYQELYEQAWAARGYSN